MVKYLEKCALDSRRDIWRTHDRSTARRLLNVAGMRTSLLRSRSIRSIFGWIGCATCATAILVSACSSTDTEEISVTDNPIQPSDIDDKAPAETPYDPSLSFKGRYGGNENHSQARYRFDVAAFDDDAERQRAEQLYASHAAFLSANGGLPSVQTIGTYVKQLDDSLYAGVERAAQDGVAPTLEPKRQVLMGALSYLSQHRSAAGDEALVLSATALRLGGQSAEVPADLAQKADALKSEFLAAEAESKPFGFYTWSPELRQIWQQDRLLQRPLASPAASCAFAEAIAAEPQRKQQYLQLTQLYARLTNPLRSSLADMLDVAATPACLALPRQAFIGRSATPEVALFERLYPNGVPANADLMGDLVKAIRAGTVDLAPRADDGWYQHQLFALETLLVTDKSEERAKIAFMARYKKRLQEAFSTMLVQHRETHAKQADTTTPVSVASTPPTPHFRAEPMATVYVRHARSYVFLESALDAALGAAVLDVAPAVDALGATTDTLRARLRRARDLFFGLYVVACQDIGLKISLAAPGDPPQTEWTALAEKADDWLQGLSRDPLASSDVRVMVPIAALESGKYKYWAVVGVRGTLAGYSYIEGMDTSPPKPADQTRAWLATEQFVEVVSSPSPMTRDEFRALCDEKKSADAIKAALEAR